MNLYRGREVCARLITREKFYEYAMALYNFCDYPAVRYKILFSLLDTPYNDEELSVLRNEFLRSDIVEEMYQLQWDNGGWGNFKSKRLFSQSENPHFDDGDQKMPLYWADD